MSEAISEETELTQEQKQDYFNRAVAGLKAQGYKRSVDEQGYCRYRTSDGLKCAVGQLLTDEACQENDFDNGGTRGAAMQLGLGLVPDATGSVLSLGLGINARHGGSDWQFFRNLQIAHDRDSTGGIQLEMPDRLRNFAQSYDLDASCV